MNRGTAITALVVAGVMFTCEFAMADQPWPMWRQNMGRTGRSPYAGPRETVVLAWSYEVTTICSPAIGEGGRIYIPDSGMLCALNSDGSQVWSCYTGSVSRSPAMGVNEAIYAGTFDNVIYAIDSFGALEWTYVVEDECSSAPAVGPDGRVYAGSSDNCLYALNSDCGMAWSYDFGCGVTSTAIGADGTLYVCDSESLYALSSEGIPLWYYRVDGAMRTSPAIGPDGTAYANSSYSGFHALKSNGRFAWSYLGSLYPDPYNCSGSCSEPSIGPDGEIYLFFCEAQSPCGLYAFGSNGRLAWSYVTGDGGPAPAVGSDGMTYAGSRNNRLFAFTPDGKLGWSYEAASDIYSIPAIGSDGRLYVGTTSPNARLYVFGEEPTETPTETPTPSPTATATSTPTATPSPTVTATATPTITAAPTDAPTAVPRSVLRLIPNSTVVDTGDFLTIHVSVSETVAGAGPLALYVVLRAPGGGWSSFVPKEGGGFALVGGIKPAAVTGRIPAVEADIFSGTIGAGLARGNYWFGAAIFEVGRKITFDNWHSEAMYRSEVTITRQ